LTAHMRQDSHKEQLAFGLASQTETEEGIEFLVDELLFPDPEDLVNQSVAGICPAKPFQGVVYLLAQQAGKTIVEFHTHPGPWKPHFSLTDEQYGVKNAEYIVNHFPEPTTLLMVVGNNRFDAFEGIVFDRKVRKFIQIARWETLGRPTGISVFGQDVVPSAGPPSDLFDRQCKIPGWNQEGLERQRIGILGAGGNGAPLVQLLAGIGAGRQGFIAIADPDTIEPSNLPRIPYACAEHVGTAKVVVAADYIRRKSPGTPVFSFACRFNDTAVRRRMKMATTLFQCGDNNGGRKEANDLAVRYGIPLIDLGCDIQVSKESVVAGGQVRLVLPGQTACLVCCRGFDPAQAAIDQMSEASRALQAVQGYVVGAQAEATPSVANLNGFTVQFALSQFLALVNGSDFAQWDYLHFDQFTGRTIPARTVRDPECPQCGQDGYLLAGDPAEPKKIGQPKIRPWGEGPPKGATKKRAPAQPTTSRKWWKRTKKT
ncbi:MAG TPA: ThiF family adenylyltransferase, partial [Sedimentisphaerales bacterium]|nr:ThiF family adenylyltransferase [Sedimentisphaerales bacterium]